MSCAREVRTEQPDNEREAAECDVQEAPDASLQPRDQHVVHEAQRVACAFRIECVMN